MIDQKELVKTWEYNTMIKFLKSRKLYHLFVKSFYSKDKIYGCDGDLSFLEFLSLSVSYTSHFNDFALDLTKRRISKEKRLVISQLWRFFALEELDSYDDSKGKRNLDSYALSYKLKRSIEANGFRDSEEVKKLFEKHKNFIKY